MTFDQYNNRIEFKGHWYYKVPNEYNSCNIRRENCALMVNDKCKRATNIPIADSFCYMVNFRLIK